MGLTDREIDVLVAEKILGCRTNWDCGHYVDGETEKHYTDSEGPDTQFYSTDLTAAWVVVDEILKRRAWSVDVMFNADERRYRVCLFDIEIPERPGVAADKSLPRAICLAALKAIGVEVEP